MDLVKPISMEVLEALGPTYDVCQVAAKQGETALLVGSSEQRDKMKPSNDRALVWFALGESVRVSGVIHEKPTD
jgi:hypothetical protein